MSQRKHASKLTFFVENSHTYQASKMMEETGSLYKSQVSSGTQKSPFNANASGSVTNNTAHLKGKLSSLEDLIKTLAEELNYHKKEVNMLRSEKETLESVLTMKT